MADFDNEVRLAHVNSQKPRATALKSYRKAFLQAHKPPTVLIAHDPPRRQGAHGQFLLNHELICFQHPKGVPTMISAGKVVQVNQNPFSRVPRGLNDRIYCELFSASGSSGGPVYNADGKLVGLLTGTTDSRDGNYSHVLPMSAIWADSGFIRDLVAGNAI